MALIIIVTMMIMIDDVDKNDGEHYNDDGDKVLKMIIIVIT